MENITTNKIIDRLYNDQLEKKIPKKGMQSVIAAFVLAIREELKKGNKVSIAGLGTFTAKFSAGKYLADEVYRTKVEG